MSKHIEVSDQDYARIQRAADAAGVPLGPWVVAKLPLEHENGESEPLLGPDGQPAKSMADLFAGRLGRFNSGTGQPSSSNIGESFAEYLEEKHRKGTL